MTTLDLRILNRIVLECKGAPVGRSRMWTPEEDDFLRQNLGFLTDEEMGERLGRSEVAVHLRWERDLHLPAPSKNPDYITAHQAARMLGIDGHKIVGWVDHGLIPSRIMAGGRNIRLIKCVHFMMFACSPKNWVWFDPNKVADPKLKRMLKMEQKRWGDEWWSTRQVADHHGADVGDVQRYIKLGYLKSYHLPISLGGRDHNRKWSNHFVLKSEATRKDLIFMKRGKGNTLFRKSPFTPAADAFLLKARDEWDLSFIEIGRLMKIGKWTYHNRTNPIIFYHYHELKKAQARKKSCK